ncbi:MAG TPA: hypothetical protein PKY35_07920 [Candidatus Hydrogenedentes bacterium]|mgnify:CR=1 FL=1|nr:hypothetical protein [Candidatus Hydrogenedentota bacterium]HOL76940.1 hypothetical protein [Candidatus Hydrogenedentota bacterium]HPO87310.1 hypothetical protein [Candidatus Hydrogenedentota bacterium]
MSKQNRLFLVIGAVVLFVAVFALFRLPFVHTNLDEIYPEYSSFRSDPLGTRVFYEALKELPGLEISRNTRPFSDMVAKTDLAFLLLGVETYGDANEVEKEVIEPLENLARQGARVVIAFYPHASRPSFVEEDSEDSEAYTSDESGETDHEEANEGTSLSEESNGSGASTEHGADSEGEEPLLRPKEVASDETVETVRLPERWGVTCAWSSLPRGNDGKFSPDSAVRCDNADSALPERLVWYSGLYFSDLSPEWRTLYRRDDKPVIAERSWGDGSIVMVGDTYFVSNEGLWREKYTGLLVWLVDSKRHIVFDEYLKGIRENPGIMTLVKRFRLNGLLVGFAVVFLLWLWQNAMPFVPRYSESEQTEILEVENMTGQDCLINLVRRGVPPADLMEVCLKEWETTMGVSETLRQTVSFAPKKGRGEADVVKHFNRLVQRIAMLELGKTLPYGGLSGVDAGTQRLTPNNQRIGDK